MRPHALSFPGRSVVRRWALERSGYALVELLVAMVAGVTVLSACFALLESSQLVQARDSESALVIQEDRAGLARMVRDIRMATKVEEAKAGAIVFNATIGGTEYEIKYECAVAQAGTEYTECARYAAEKGKALPANGVRVARDIVNGTSVFTYTPSSAEAKAAIVRLEIPSQGTLKQAGTGTKEQKQAYKRKIVLEDAAFMRNVYPEG